MRIETKKPYLRAAGMLVFFGIAGVFFLTAGLGMASKVGAKVPEPWLSIFTLAPLAFVAAGVLLFIYGKLRRL